MCCGHMVYPSGAQLTYMYIYVLWTYGVPLWGTAYIYVYICAVDIWFTPLGHSLYIYVYIYVLWTYGVPLWVTAYICMCIYIYIYVCAVDIRYTPLGHS